MRVKQIYEGKYVGVAKWWALNANRTWASKKESDGWETMFASNRVTANDHIQERICE